MPQQAHFERYILPLVPVLAVLAGSVRAAVPFALVALVLPLAWSVSDARELTRTDTRVRADAWVAANVPAATGSRPIRRPCRLPAARCYGSSCRGRDARPIPSATWRGCVARE